MDVQRLLDEGRELWPDRMRPADIVVALNVTTGDLARQVRNQTEGQRASDAEVRKELGNLVRSAIRWMDDLGFSPEECLAEALEAQRRYTARPAPGASRRPGTA